MAYHNKGGASNALKYFNDQADLRRAQVGKEIASVETKSDSTSAPYEGYTGKPYDGKASERYTPRERKAQAKAAARNRKNVKF
jgi:hypothetical protein